jgi:hypothetical protein
MNRLDEAQAQLRAVADWFDELADRTGAARGTCRAANDDLLELSA